MVQVPSRNLNISVGPLAVRLKNIRSNTLHKVFSQYPPTNVAPHLVFEFPTVLPETPTPVFSIGSAKGNETILYNKDFRGYEYCIMRDTESSRLSIYAKYDSHSKSLAPRERLKKHRFFNAFYLTSDELQYEAFIYSLWHFLSHLALLSANCGLIHASCVAKNGGAVLFPAWGGVGKTSICYQLILADRWKFVSDDITIVSRSGNVVYNPTRIAFYPYNLAGQGSLRTRLLGKRSRIDRFHWHFWRILLGNARVGRRVYPSDIYGNDGIISEAKLEKVIHLVRHDRSQFELTSLAHDELARLSSNIIMAEIKQFTNELQLYQAIPYQQIFPTVQELLSKTHSVYQEAFEQTDVYLCSIPTRAKPRDIYDFLSARI